MTVNKDEKEPEIVVNDPTMVTAVGIEEKKGEGGVHVGVSAAGGPGNGPPIPAGHSRFYCSKCRSVSLLLLNMLLLNMLLPYNAVYVWDRVLSCVLCGMPAYIVFCGCNLLLVMFGRVK